MNSHVHTQTGMALRQRTDSAADSKLFAQQMTQMARMDAVRTQVIPVCKCSIVWTDDSVLLLGREHFQEEGAEGGFGTDVLAELAGTLLVNGS